jgi:hypothetical protein
MNTLTELENKLNQLNLKKTLKITLSEIKTIFPMLDENNYLTYQYYMTENTGLLDENEIYYCQRIIDRLIEIENAEVKKLLDYVEKQNKKHQEYLNSLNDLPKQ